MTTTRWDEIDALIAEHKKDLKAASTHEVLKDFATRHDLMNKGDFSKFKHLLKKIGVNYDELREVAFAAANEQRAHDLDKLVDAPTVTLWAAAVIEEDKGAFAIVDGEGEARWYGAFFDDDRIWEPGDLVSAEQSVADKAVWLASKALAAKGCEIGELVLTTTCPELDTAALHAQGVRLGVKVTITVDDSDDRAVWMAQTPGYRSWKETDLSELVDVGEDE